MRCLWLHCTIGVTQACFMIVLFLSFSPLSHRLDSRMMIHQGKIHYDWTEKRVDPVWADHGRDRLLHWLGHFFDTFSDCRPPVFTLAHSPHLGNRGDCHLNRSPDICWAGSHVSKCWRSLCLLERGVWWPVWISVRMGVFTSDMLRSHCSLEHCLRLLSRVSYSAGRHRN